MFNYKMHKKAEWARRVLPVLLVLALSLAIMLALPARAADSTPALDSDGDGYVEIDSAEKLWWFTQQVNGGNNSLNAELTANIDLSGTCGEGIGNWQPIGNKYSGHFNGQGHTISNLYMSGDDQYIGLFGYVKGATIENVTVTGSVSSMFSFIYYPDTYESFEGAAGGVVAYLNGGTIRNCHVDMTVSGGYTIGGICGELDSDGLIENCTTLGSAVQGGEDVNYIGGIVGDLWSGTVRDCTNAATVGNILETANYAGGIAGASFGIIENCLNFGNVEIAGTYGGHGGITGNQGIDCIVRNCGNYGTVSGYCTGGIVGDNCGIIENCYNVGSVSGTSEYVTPIASSRDGGTATNCYYLSDAEIADGGRTAEQFASGQVTYELNGSTTTDESVWKQTLGTDSYPTLTGDNVYYVTSKKCDGTVIGQIYSNSSKDIIVHEDTDSDGDLIYDVCGTFTFSGSGTEEDPYLVSTVAELQAALRSTANEKNYIRLITDMKQSWSNAADLMADTTPFDLDLDGYELSLSEEFYISVQGSIHDGSCYSDIFTQDEARLDMANISGTLEPYLNAVDNSIIVVKDSALDTLFTDDNGKIVADNVTISSFYEQIYKCWGGSLVLDGVTFTESIYEPHYPYEHIDADGNCRCDNGWDMVHKGTPSVYESGNNGTHDICWSCCNWIETFNVACTPAAPDDDCTTPDACACGYAVPGATEHTTAIKGDKDDEHHILECTNEGCAHEEDAEHQFAENILDSFVAAEATCVSGTTYYKSCECGHASSETFVNGDPDPDAHSLVYTLESDQYNGKKITETCANGCTHSAYVTLARHFGAAYTGEPITAGLVLVGYGGNLLCGQPTVQYSQNGVPVDEVIYPGNYTASITVGDQTASVDTSVSKGTPTYTVPTGLTAAYGQRFSEVALPAGWSWPTPENIFATLGEQSHYAVFTPEDPELYSSPWIQVTVTVSEAALRDVAVVETGSLTYTGVAQTPTVEASATTVDGAAVTFTYCLTENGTYTAELPTFTNAGTYTVYFKANAEKHAEFGGSFEIVVGKATNEWTQAPAIVGWTYGEFGNDPTATPKFGEVGLSSFSYRVKGTLAWTNNPPSDAGIYEMRTRVQASDNWELLETTIEFEIKKATPTIETFDFTPPANLDACDGLAKEATVTVREGIEGVGSITVQYFKGDEMLSGAPTKAGTYTVKINVAEGANFTATEALELGSFTFDVVAEADHADVVLRPNGDGTHDKLCSVCEKVIESGTTCSGTTTDDCDKGYLCACGAYFGTKEHDFSGKHLADSDGHWHECKDCGATDEKLAHTPEEDDGDCLSAIVCSACGYETTKGQLIHDFNNANLYDESKHWHKCARCEVTAAKYDHAFTVLVSDGTHHWHKCEECEAIDEKVAHAYNVPAKDSTDHWNKCFGCEAIDTKIKHSGEDDGNCTTEVKCTCGTVLTEAMDDHSFDHACDTDCNTPGCTHTRTITHTPETDDGSCLTAIRCSVCQVITTEARPAHTGGEPTCTEPAVCTVCGSHYGKATGHDYSVPTYDEVAHWTKCSACDAITKKVAHSEIDDGDCLSAIVCSCGYTVLEARDAHTGGEATCASKAECEICGTPYGEQPDHTFTLPGRDDTHHWTGCRDCDAVTDKALHEGEDDGSCLTALVCSCGHVIAEARDAHEGGHATCSEKAKCEICGTPWGELGDHNYIIPGGDDTHHWMACEGCDATGEKTPHSGEDDGDCTTAVTCSCGHVITAAKDAHAGGEATCTERAECAICGTAYGDTAAHKFTRPANDDTQHWKLCESCDATGEKAPHNGEATCQRKAHCTVCDMDHGDVDPSKHEADTFTYTAAADGKTHEKKHACCGTVAAAGEAHTYGEDDLCACGARKPAAQVTVTVENGTAAGEEGSTVTVDENGTVTVTANAAPEGQTFKGWAVNGELVSTEATYTFTATADMTLTAVYEPLSGEVTGGTATETTGGEPDTTEPGTTGPEKPDKSDKTGLIILIVVIAVLLVGGGVAVCYFVLLKRQREEG